MVTLQHSTYRRKRGFGHRSQDGSVAQQGSDEKGEETPETVDVGDRRSLLTEIQAAGRRRWNHIIKTHVKNTLILMRKIINHTHSAQ